MCATPLGAKAAGSCPDVAADSCIPFAEGIAQNSMRLSRAWVPESRWRVEATLLSCEGTECDDYIEETAPAAEEHPIVPESACEISEADSTSRLYVFNCDEFSETTITLPERKPFYLVINGQWQGRKSLDGSETQDTFTYGNRTVTVSLAE